MNAQPCTCTHPAAVHTDLSGCLESSQDGQWCPCTKYVPEGAPTREEGRAEGRALRDQGTSIAGSGAPALVAEVWKAKARDCIANMATEGRTFSADDVTECVGPPPVPAMLGAVFLAASRRKVIQPEGYVTASRPSAHGRPQRTWTGAQDGLR